MIEDTPPHRRAPMTKPSLALIAAVARNGVIGSENRLPWRLPEDMKWFKALTTGHRVIMGRKTWDSLGRPLAHRDNVVVSRNADLQLPGATVVPSLEAALALPPNGFPPPAFCIGGGQIYTLALPLADCLYLTEIDADFPGDARFPPIDHDQWVEVAREKSHFEPSDGKPGFDYYFVTYRRHGAASHQGD